jgi:hypothetical protein
VRRFPSAAKWRPHAPALLPGIPAVGLLIVWAAHEGGFFPDTWYWGALAMLALLVVTVVGLGPRLDPIPRALQVALVAFGLYVIWSYLSITWAQYPGAALEGSNRALLYWLVLALFAIIPWTVETALAALTVFVLAVGTIAVVIVVELATGDHSASLFISGRLASPTGYYNASAALFTMAALVGIALAARRELPVLLRAVLLAIACAGLQLALIGQSRGWLFTLPLVAVAGIAVLSDRLRVVLAATPPILATLAAVHRLLDVYRASDNGKSFGHAFNHAATRAGWTSLALCAAVLLVGALIALADTRLPQVKLSSARRRALGLAVTALVVVGGAAGATVATHGRPFHFVARQWDGFSHPETGPAPSSNFAQVGSGRYDYWRVALDAVLAHPIGGLGQDNFANYYILHRRTAEQPEWTHSLEMHRLRRLRPVLDLPHRGPRGGAGSPAARRAARSSRRRSCPAAPRRLDDPRVGRLVLGVSGAHGPSTRVPRHGHGARACEGVQGGGGARGGARGPDADRPCRARGRGHARRRRGGADARHSLPRREGDRAGERDLRRRSRRCAPRPRARG